MCVLILTLLARLLILLLKCFWRRPKAMHMNLKPTKAMHLHDRSQATRTRIKRTALYRNEVKAAARKLCELLLIGLSCS